jgi:hypothetical protein
LEEGSTKWKLAPAPALARTCALERGAAPGRVATCRAPLLRCTVSRGLRGGPAPPRALRPTPGPLRRAQAQIHGLVAGPPGHTPSHASAARIARMHAWPAGQAAHLTTPTSKHTRALAPSKTTTPAWPSSSATGCQNRRPPDTKAAGTAAVPAPDPICRPSHFSPSPRPQATFPVALYPASTPGTPARWAPVGAALAPRCGSSPAARPARNPPQIDTCEPPRYSGHLLRPNPVAAGREFRQPVRAVCPGTTLQDSSSSQGVFRKVGAVP